MTKNKSDRLHNKGCHLKGQYNVTFSCTKGLSIQTKSAWQPLLPSAKGLSFTTWMTKNKSDRLHNKGCHLKGQYNVTFSCTKGLSIQTKSAWQPLLPSAKGLSFTFMYLLSCKSQSFSLYSFLFFSFGKHHVVRKDLGTYVQLNTGSMSYYR